MKLVEITYYRNNDTKKIKKAIVSKIQCEEIGKLPHIKIICVKEAPENSKRNYILR